MQNPSSLFFLTLTQSFGASLALSSTLLNPHEILLIVLRLQLDLKQRTKSLKNNRQSGKIDNRSVSQVLVTRFATNCDWLVNYSDWLPCCCSKNHTLSIKGRSSYSSCFSYFKTSIQNDEQTTTISTFANHHPSMVVVHSIASLTY